MSASLLAAMTGTTARVSHYNNSFNKGCFGRAPVDVDLLCKDSVSVRWAGLAVSFAEYSATAHLQVSRSNIR